MKNKLILIGMFFALGAIICGIITDKWVLGLLGLILILVGKEIYVKQEASE